MGKYALGCIAHPGAHLTILLEQESPHTKVIVYCEECHEELAHIGDSLTVTNKGRSSVMERDIGPHEHKMIIIISYEVYAVCKKCGYHDWSLETLGQYRNKYPIAEEDNQMEEEN